MTRSITLAACVAAMMLASPIALAHSEETASSEQKTSDRPAWLSRIHVGGYGEVAFSRNFYSDSYLRYVTPETYRDARSHGRFDIPHAVIFLGYDFGKGWSFSSEIEFEHIRE